MPDNISWDAVAQQKFDQMIAKVPKPLQGMVSDMVIKKATTFALEGNRSEMNEKDLVDAFFEATPFGFHGPMKTDMEDIGIDYVQYGHPE